jgi:type II secretory pathway pseudopilin PulG
MRSGVTGSGYTIIEVMIFLAVSGFMFITAAAFVSGKQATAEFRQSMNQMNSNMAQIINDVSNGVYPSNNSVSCTANASGGAPSATEGAAESTTQGSNGSCVYMGRIIQFGPGTADNTYKVYTVVGRQYTGAINSEVPVSFEQAEPAIVEGSISTTTTEIPQGSTLSKVYAPDEDGATRPYYAVGIFNGFGKYRSLLLNSGAQTALVVPLGEGVIASGQSEQNIKDILNDPQQIDAYLSKIPNPAITVCLDSGRGQHGSLSIGSSTGQRLSSNIKVGKPAEIGC